MLALLKGFDLDKLSPTDADFIHTWVECAKLAYADREAFYGDPKFVDVPMQTLLSEAYNAERRKLVGAGGLDGPAAGQDRGLRRRASSSRARGLPRPAPASRRLRACTPATAPTSSRSRAAAR